MNESVISKITYNYMGFFTTEDIWIHPKVSEITYEIIYVTKGKVYLSEGDRSYILEKGDLIVLKPGAVHYGNKHSSDTSFYWLHYNCDEEYETFVIRGFTGSFLFKELMHYSHMPNCPEYVKNAVLRHIIAEIYMSEINANVSSLGNSVFEWTRINVSRSLTVGKVAQHFGYNSEYMSRLIKREYGITLKRLIDDFLMDKAKEYLSNVKLSIKEISTLLGFNNANAFVIFFKYHERISPKKYRNSYSYIHMNKK